MASAHPTDDVRVSKCKALIPPACILDEIEISKQIETHVLAAREAVSNIVHGKDDRLLVVVGPCSIHDPEAGLAYAKKLAPLREKFAATLCIVMRVYFEKPRTTVGWKGLINDPDLNGSFNINRGLRVARKLLLDINALGLPAGCEFLDTISPQYICDLVSWGAIGARTTESQVHRELASGISCPVGFKNGTGGSVQIAVDGASSASHPHSFLGVTKDGIAAIVTTTGNNACHIILRGGKSSPNYEAEHVSAAAEVCRKAGLSDRLMVDCSHANSRKDHTRQPLVAQSVAEQISSGSQNILGVMIESNLVEGKQSLPEAQAKCTDPSTGAQGVLKFLDYGKSITDACIDVPATESVLQLLSDAIAQRRALR